MKIVSGYPPNIEKIKKAFPIRPTTSFTYGDTIYIPSGKSRTELDDSFIAHEEIHEKQQGADPEEWWDRYFADNKFRFEQELEAYQAQYKFFAKGKDRNKSFLYLHKIAGDLSGDLYGNIVSYEKAKKLIKL